MCLRSLVLSLHPVARNAILRESMSADGVVLDVGVLADSSRRLIFRVRNAEASELARDELEIGVEELVQLVEPNGTTEVIAPASTEVELVADVTGELQVITHGRTRIVAPVRIRRLNESILGFRILAGYPGDTRPTMPSLRAVAA